MTEGKLSGANEEHEVRRDGLFRRKERARTYVDSFAPGPITCKRTDEVREPTYYEKPHYFKPVCSVCRRVFAALVVVTCSR
jgi:hypothetical protein